MGNPFSKIWESVDHLKPNANIGMFYRRSTVFVWILRSTKRYKLFW